MVIAYSNACKPAKMGRIDRQARKKNRHIAKNNAVMIPYIKKIWYITRERLSLCKYRAKPGIKYRISPVFYRATQ
jgi:hypothetical protein